MVSTTSSVSSAYIHIPFCKNICNYCDFPKWIKREDVVKEYLKALDREIEEIYQGEELKTIYIGGGTPSCLELDELDTLFSVLNKLKRKTTCEITIECNIEDIEEEKLEMFKHFGINRISIGIETTCKKYFNLLGRKNTKEEIKKKITLCQKMGIQNINLDLMYAFPDQTEEELESDLDFLLSLEIPHLSTYSLQIEEHTKLYLDGVKEIDKDQDAKFYKIICKKLKEKEYVHYEISNFSKKGYESRHNLVYWHNEHYYGFGLGAASYLQNIRKINTRSMSKYKRGEYELTKEELTLKEKAYYELILGLRTKEGINKSKLKETYQDQINKWFQLETLIKKGIIKENETHYFIEEEKFYVLNSILVLL